MAANKTSNKIQRILYDPQQERPPRDTGCFSVGDQLKLKPGYNNINANSWAAASDNRFVAQRIEWEAIKVIGSEVPKEKQDSLMGLSVDASIDLVSATKDQKILEGYLEKEQSGGKNRTKVINAINKQLKSISDGDLSN